MARKDESVYLKDMRRAIVAIETYVADTTLERFVQNNMQHDAVIRQLEIIGEAAKRLPGDFTQRHPDFPLREAADMRNFLIHGYDEVSLKTVWKTVHEDIPVLKQHLMKILNT